MSSIAVAGGTGLIGRQLVDILSTGGHHVSVLARSHGVDLSSGDGLNHALTDVQAVIDVTNTRQTDPERARAFFEASTGNLLRAGKKTGVRHHIALSIVGVDRVHGNGHYVGKRARNNSS